jgi:small-conductance mechanosensitive channel
VPAPALRAWCRAADESAAVAKRRELAALQSITEHINIFRHPDGTDVFSKDSKQVLRKVRTKAGRDRRRNSMLLRPLPASIKKPTLLRDALVFHLYQKLLVRVLLPCHRALMSLPFNQLVIKKKLEE